MTIEQQLINPVEQALLVLMIIVIMFGMGSALTVNDFKNAWKNPKGMMLGIFCTFGLMPVIAFGLTKALQLPAEIAIALILLGCLPAGTTSNMFTYFSRGDVALSISMTACNTVLAIGMTPLLLEIFASGYAQQIDEAMKAVGVGDFAIPYRNIVISLFLVLVPVGLGMWLLKKSPGWAKAAEDTAGFMGVIIILFLIGSAAIRHGNLFLDTSWKIYCGGILLGLVGFLFGYALSLLFSVSPRFKRAISLESGIKNGPLAFTIILLSFKEPIQSQILWVAILYAVFIVINSSIVTLFFRKIGKKDWEIYKNELVQKRLFGST